MSEQNIFGGDTNAPTAAPAASSDDLGTILASIKNENGDPKYKDVKTALEALNHSQQYIPTLKSDLQKAQEELDAIRRENERLKTIQDTLDKIGQVQQPAASQPEPQKVDPDAIASLVEQRLNQKSVQEKAQANLQKTAQTVKEKFGDKAEEIFYGTAQSLGLSKEAINSIAAQSPDAALKLLGISQTTTPSFTPSAAKSAINTSGQVPTSDNFVARNAKGFPLGATTHDVMAEHENAKQMVAQLNSQGLSIDDLTQPKNFFKVFGPI